MPHKFKTICQLSGCCCYTDCFVKMMQLVDARLLLSCKSLVQRTIQHVFVERTIITIVYRLVTIIYFHKELAEC